MSFEVNSEGCRLSWLDDAFKWSWSSNQIKVTVNSGESDLWPSTLASIFENPRLSESRINEYWPILHFWLSALCHKRMRLLEFLLERMHLRHQRRHSDLSMGSWNYLWWRIVLTLQECWGLTWVSDLEHWIWWLHSFLAFLAKVKVISDGTLVPYS